MGVSLHMLKNATFIKFPILIEDIIFGPLYICTSLVRMLRFFQNRYKKLLAGVDLTKDFFFSYTYRIMLNMQTNVGTLDDERMPYENMFVWNAFLTSGIRQRLGNTRWTVALVHGFFEQVAEIPHSCLFPTKSSVA